MPLSQAEAAAKKKAEKDAEKAAKAAAAPAKKKSAEEEEDELDANQYKERRQLFVKHLEQAGTTAYPHKFHVDTTLPSFHEQYASCPDGEKVAGASVAVAGRVLLARGQGKLRFYDLHADGVKIQVMTDPTAYTAGDEHITVEYSYSSWISRFFCVSKKLVCRSATAKARYSSSFLILHWPVWPSGPPIERVMCSSDE